MENEPILKKTLLTVAIMVAAWVTFVGTVSLLAVVITSHAVAPFTPSDGREAPALEKPSLGSVPVTPGAPSKSRSADRGHGQPI
jgi:hypothetical protein